MFLLYLSKKNCFCCGQVRYGNIDELKEVVKTFHDVGIKVLGDVVLNHRCAHYKNQNGVWNIFGGRLNWDERAVVADDPHFQVLFISGFPTFSYPSLKFSFVTPKEKAALPSQGFLKNEDYIYSSLYICQYIKEWWS